MFDDLVAEGSLMDPIKNTGILNLHEGSNCDVRVLKIYTSVKLFYLMN